MNIYSICYLDAGGSTQSSEVLSFEDNPSVIAFARTGVLRNAIVEVWRNSDLVVRLFRDEALPMLAGVSAADNATQAFARADRRHKLEEREPERGARPPAALLQ